MDRAGATPFWRAAYALDVPAMRLLVAYGAAPSTPTRKMPQRRFGRRGASRPDMSGLPPVPTQRGTLAELREMWLAPLERRYLSDLLRECNGNVRRAAALADINPVTMYRLLKKRGLRLRREVSSEP